MTLPQHRDPGPPRRRAKAPYNFVPLPEKVLYLRDTPDPESSEIPTQDAYHKGRHSGWFDCTLTAETPLYVRCALRPEQAGKVEAKQLPEFFYTDPRSFEPVLPGSTLRGMLRSLVEIISYSKVQPVTDGQKMSFRAVAAPREDPLSASYQQVLGRYGANIKAGYLSERGEEWVIVPAFRPAEKRMSERGAYLKVKDHSIPDGALAELVRFTTEGYLPQYHAVTFDVEEGRGAHGPYTRVVNIGPEQPSGRHHGVLVCSGNMAESGEAARSTRKNYALVLEPKRGVTPLPISTQVVQDYLNTLTEFQTEAPFDKKRGCLVDGRPVFYVESGNQVVAFGHCPNFRIPARLAGGSVRAATPLDFVPAALRHSAETDLAEAMFGYVEPAEQKGRPVARAGRVSVSDAHLEAGQCDVWVSQEPITPRILATPKPTTFQHYLVQTEPDRRQELRHYGSATPDETVIRGHKLYWHKPGLQPEDWMENPDSIETEKADTQHTWVKPVREGTAFYFRVTFEDLSDVELGALAWILDTAGSNAYRLKLGMGKPLGLGSVKVKADPHITDRASRYAQLLTADGWYAGEVKTPESTVVKACSAFEQFVLGDETLNPGHATALKHVPRIGMLLDMLSWPGPPKTETRYLEIENESNGNEYKERPVLPTPAGVRGRPVTGVPRPPANQPRPQPTVRPAAPHHPPIQPDRAAEPVPVSTPKPPAAPPSPVEISHPETMAEIREGDVLEGKVISVDATSVKFKLGVEGAVGSMGLVRLDRLVQTHSYFKQMYPEVKAPTSAALFREGNLEEDLLGTRMHVRVLGVNHQHGKTTVKLDFVAWLD